MRNRERMNRDERKNEMRMRGVEKEEEKEEVQERRGR